MMKAEEYRIFTLSGGLKCVHRLSNSLVSYSGLVVGSGSSSDPTCLPGLAHYVEHTIFKGTERRSGWQINNMAEAVGGELNAYTTKEETVIHVSLPSPYTSRALDLLSDLAVRASFPEKEIELEKEVVAEEINSYLDSPADNVFDLFEDRLYAGSGLGHNILGTPEAVHEMKREDCLDFVRKHYNASNMVLFCSDTTPHARFERMAEKFFGQVKGEESSRIAENPPMNAEFSVRIDHNAHQANTILGARLFNRYDPRRFALFLLNNYLGGPSMNSRLNRELREKRGMVYSVDSYITLLSSSGHIQVYFGCDRASTQKCLKLIRRELEKLAETAMNAAKFEKIKRQYIGQLLVASDHQESMVMSMGKSILFYDELHDPQWTSRRIQDVTPEQMRSVAEIVASDAKSWLELC